MTGLNSDQTDRAAKRVATPSASGCGPKCFPLDERQANFAALPTETALRIGTNPLNGTEEQINGSK
jgi:hypothetical protein